MLITCEVDARDEQGNLVEIKSSKNGSAKMVGGKSPLQIACNGSARMLCCHLDVDEASMMSTEWFAASDIIEAHREKFIYQGQRVRLLLDRLCSHELLNSSSIDGSGDVGDVIELTFDQGREPVLRPAPSGVEVLPHGDLASFGLRLH